MVRARSMLPALVVAVALLGPAPAALAVHADGPPGGEQSAGPQASGRVVTPRAQHVARRANGGDPLAVTIASLTPSAIPTTGPIIVTGTVTNLDDQTWRRVNVYATFDGTPITTEKDLSAAATSDTTTFVGNRITEAGPGTSHRIEILKPGQTKSYAFYVPRSALVVDQYTDPVPVSTPGVYWFGVHALGENDDGRDSLADGRARTFLPLVPDGAKPVRTALVMPVRHEVTYTSDGRVDDLPGWTRTLSPGGRLRSLVELGAAAGTRRLTWLIDPAVVDAVRRIAAGDPPRSIAPTLPPGGKTSPSASPSATTPAPPSVSARVPADGPVDSPSASASPPPDDTPLSIDPVTHAAQAAAIAWLSRLRTALGGQQILALPYGDPDLAAAAEHDPSLYHLARQRSGTTLQPWGLKVVPAVGSPSGYLDADAVQMVDPGSTILVSDKVYGARAPAVASTEGRTLVTTSSAAAAGGPGPGDPLALLNLRQRILAEAALRAIGPGHQPLVVSLPEQWTPLGTAGFYDGLDASFVRLASVGAAASHRARPVALSRLHYPLAQTTAQLDGTSFEAAQELIRAGQALQDILVRNDQVAGQVTDQALAATSYASRRHATTTASTALASKAWISDVLDEVHVTGPSAVTLSSASGRFAATVVNDVDQAVVVKIAATSDRDVTIQVPPSVEVAAHGRKTVLLDADTTKDGVHQVTLLITDSQGRPLGSSDQLPLRSAEVSNIIWLALALGAGLLFGTLALRVVRRVRRAGAP